MGGGGGDARDGMSGERGELPAELGAFLAELRDQTAQVARATILLEHAVETLKFEPAGEERNTRAQRLRGAAVVAQSAALELMVTCGWLECAHAAEASGLMERLGRPRNRES